MKITLVVAMDENGLIGTGTGMPWHLPADLKRFRNLTTGKPIIMGRTTHETIGRPLPERTNIILTRRADYVASGCEVANTIEEALRLAEMALAKKGGDEVMVVGGAEVYAAFLPRVKRIYLTIVSGTFMGTTFFPTPLPLGPEWREVHREEIPADAKNAHSHRFSIWERGA